MRWYRRQARSLSESLARLRKTCERLGIELVIQGEERKNFHGQKNPEHH